MKIKIKLFEEIKKIFVYILVINLLANFLSPFVYAQDSSDETDNNTVVELNQKIKDNKDKINELTEQMENYKKEIATHQAKAASLGSQLTLLEDRIKKTELDLQTTQARIDTVDLELEKLGIQIAEKEKTIEAQKEKLANLIRTMYKLSRKSYLEILILNDSFSDFFNQLQYITKLQESLKNSVDQVKKYKQELEIQKLNVETKKTELASLKATLNEQMITLSEQRVGKENLLTETKSSEKTFQSLVSQLKQEQLQIDAEISRLESSVRQKLLGKKDGTLPGVVSLTWPVSPDRGITAYFHDPDYPYRYIFEHPAVDIRAGQGSAIKASESGYVARAKSAGLGYSYIMLIHGNNLATVYGHVSRIDVKEDDYVVKGQVIGAVGGMPGTPGAGRLTTGPHLHFEVRSNGIPVNPLEYLP